MMFARAAIAKAVKNMSSINCVRTVAFQAENKIARPAHSSYPFGARSTQSSNKNVFSGPVGSYSCYKYIFAQMRQFSTTKRPWFRKRKRALSYDVVEPAEVSSEPRMIGDHIERPDYAATGIANEHRTEIEIKNEKQIQCMKESCALCRMILDEVSKHVQVGRTTDELDYIVHCMCNSYGAYPSPLNYRGFPKSVCTSVNNIACHGIPDSRPLKDGDIISIDVSVYYNGYHGDCAATYGVGNVDFKGQLLMAVALKCLEDTIKICQPGQPFCVIGETISEIAHKNGCTVVPAFCGHGIGSYFHGPPNIFHCENDDRKLMEEGMTFTIEPVICEGEPDIVILEDGWTAATEDNSRCAQFEHTILITKDGAEVLTKPNAVSVQRN